MTQKYQVKVSMKQAAIVETGIVLKQGDFGMQMEIEVLDFDTTGTTPQIVFRKAMGAVESTTITVSGNKYTYTFKGTELDTPGKCFCDLKLKNSTTQRISTASFMFKVVADTMDGLNEQASSYSDTIEQIVSGFDDDIEALDTSIKDEATVSNLNKNAFVEMANNGNYDLKFLMPMGNIDTSTGEITWYYEEGNHWRFSELVDAKICDSFTVKDGYIGRVYGYYADGSWRTSAVYGNTTNETKTLIVGNYSKFRFCVWNTSYTRITKEEAMDALTLHCRPFNQANDIITGKEELAEVKKSFNDGVFNYPINKIQFERGQIKSDDGTDDIRDVYGLRTKGFIDVEGYDTIESDGSLYVRFYQYDKTKTLINGMAYNNTDPHVIHILPATKYLRAWFCTSSYGSPTPAETMTSFVIYNDVQKRKETIQELTRSSADKRFELYDLVPGAYNVSGEFTELSIALTSSFIPAEYINRIKVYPGYLFRMLAFDGSKNFLSVKVQSLNGAGMEYLNEQGTEKYYRFTIWGTGYANVTKLNAVKNIVLFSDSPANIVEKNINNSLNSGVINYKPIYEEGGMSNTGVISASGAKLTGLIPAEYIDEFTLHQGYFIRICNFDYDGTFINHVVSLLNGNEATYNIKKQYAVWNLKMLRICVWTAPSYGNPSYLEIDDAVEYRKYVEPVDGIPSVPSYFEKNVTDAIEASAAHLGLAGNNGERFVFITDVHWEANTRNSPALIKRVVENLSIPNVLCGGDILVRGEKAAEISALRNFINKVRFLDNKFKVVFGNHDRNQDGIDDETKWLTQAEFYAEAQKESDSPTLYYGDYCYFHFDCPSTKTRFICLDTERGRTIRQAQMTWVSNLLNTNDGYKVIIVAHALFETGQTTEAADVQALYDLCDQHTDKVFCIIAGHVHYDMVRTTTAGIPVIFTDCDACLTLSDVGNEPGTINEQCFDIITADYENGKIYCDRVGRGTSREITRTISS